MITILILAGLISCLGYYAYDKTGPKRMQADYQNLSNRLEAVRFHNWLTFANEIEAFHRKYAIEPGVRDLKHKLDNKMLSILQQNNATL